MLVFVFYDRKQIHIVTVLYQIIYSFCVDRFAPLHIYSQCIPFKTDRSSYARLRN